MKILIVEDDYDKKEKVKNFICSLIQSPCHVIEKESLRSALYTLMESQDYDILILDMSLPNFDISEDEPGGGSPESFAGEELIDQMKLREINVPTIIVTQYDIFSSDHGRISLEELDKKFKNICSNFYIGSVYYDAATESWKDTLAELINKVIL